MQENTRRGAFIGNEVSLYGKYNAILFEDVSIYDGFRRDIMDTNGAIDPGLVSAALRDSGTFRRDDALIATYVAEGTGGSNGVSLFYNLLRMYYMCKFGEVTYDPKELFYNNGHVKILNEQMFIGNGNAPGPLKEAVEFGEINLSAGYSYDWADVVSQEHTSIAWPGVLDDKHASILSKACSEWRQRSPFAIAHSSPELTPEIEIWGCGGRINTSDRKFSAADVAVVIDKLVTSNKLYTDFDIAYGMVCQLLTTPVPRSVEAAAWFLDVQTVSMPNLHLDTGRLNMLRGGVSYTRDAGWKNTYTMWRRVPTHALMHSIAVNEAVYVELGNIARTDDMDAVNRTNFVEVATVGTPIGHNGVLVDLTLIAMRYGRQINMSYAVSPGLTRTAGMNGNVTARVPVIVTDLEAPRYYNLPELEQGQVLRVEDRTTVIVTNYTPAQYPVLSYGVNADNFYANNWEGEVTLDNIMSTDKLFKFFDKQKFTNFMNIMRMSGWNVTAKDLNTGNTLVNWADNASGRFLYTDLPESEDTAFIVYKKDITKRHHSWLNVGDFAGTTRINYKITHQKMCVFNGSERLAQSGVLIKHLEPSVYSRKANEIRADADMIQINVLKRLPTDFRLARYLIPGLSGVNMRWDHAMPERVGHTEEQLPVNESLPENTEPPASPTLD